MTVSSADKGIPVPSPLVVPEAFNYLPVVLGVSFGLLLLVVVSVVIVVAVVVYWRRSVE